MWPDHQGSSSPPGMAAGHLQGQGLSALRLVLFGEVNPEVQAKAKIQERENSQDGQCNWLGFEWRPGVGRRVPGQRSGVAGRPCTPGAAWT